MSWVRYGKFSTAVLKPWKKDVPEIIKKKDTKGSKPRKEELSL